jgi:1-acyl-sn-glycerol-3-phosphate acyltransferase
MYKLGISRKIHPSRAEEAILEERREEYKQQECTTGDKRGLTVFDKTPKVSVNTFINSTWAFPRSTQLIYCFCAPITIPIRISVLLASLAVALFFSKLSTFGLDTKKIIAGECPPFAAWRTLLAWPVKFCGRGLLFAVGVVWISVKGKRAKAKDAPLLISNHVCFMDPIFLVSQTGASPVSAAGNMNLPLFGNLTKMFQPILVDRENKEAAAAVAKQIKDRASSGGIWPQTVLFPEGTTTNGRALVYFKLGAVSERNFADTKHTPAPALAPALTKYTNTRATNTLVYPEPDDSARLRQVRQQADRYGLGCWGARCGRISAEVPVLAVD